MSSVAEASVAGGTLLRLTAFSDRPEGGNPAGVWIGERHPSEVEMQRLAAEVGFSETAFIAPTRGERRVVRYFSPQVEIPFCGHATIASGVALGEREGAGRFVFATPAGEVPVQVDRLDRDGIRWVAALTSVEPRQEPVADADLDAILTILGWSQRDLDAFLPPIRAFAGAWHLVLAARTAARLADLHYDFESLRAAMAGQGLTTLQLVWRENAATFRARNPFPIGGVVEDPATGAAAAALGGYLRSLGAVLVPSTLTIRQGEEMGRPSLLEVDIPASGGIVVRGTAVSLPHSGT